MTNHLAQELGGVVLLPCPFCGGRAHLERTGHVACETGWPCAHTAYFNNGTPAEQNAAAIAAWNRRSPVARELDASGGGSEPFKWEARRWPNGLNRYMTQRKYDAQTPAVQAHYKPICETCATPRAAEAGDTIKAVLDWQPLMHINKGDRLYQILEAAGLPFDDQADSLRAAMAALAKP